MTNDIRLPVLIRGDNITDTTPANLATSYILPGASKVERPFK